jgi:hypothetical protein
MRPRPEIEPLMPGPRSVVADVTSSMGWLASGMTLTLLGGVFVLAGWLGSSLGAGAVDSWHARFLSVILAVAALCFGPVMSVHGMLRWLRALREQRDPGCMLNFAEFSEDSFGGTLRDPKTGRTLRPVRDWQRSYVRDERAAWVLFDGAGRRLGSVRDDGRWILSRQGA